MSAAATAAATQTAAAYSPRLVVCIGGTGKIVGLAYVRIAKLLGIEPHVSVIDFPSGFSGYTNEDKRVDDALAAEGVTDRLSTLPEAEPNLPVTIKQIFDLDDTLADALFTAEQQTVSPTLGANQQPQIGAALAHWKLAKDADRLRSSWLGTDYDEIFFVGGLGGGTGAGFGPVLAQWAHDEGRGKKIHGVFVIPWKEIGNEGVGDLGQARNTKSLLQYFAGRGANPFHHLMIIGNPPGVDLYRLAENLDIPVSPTLLLAALYLLMRDEWGGKAQLSQMKAKMEVAPGGITLDQIKRSGSPLHLLDMLIHSRRLQLVLEELLLQLPDQRLSKVSLWFFAKPLCWNTTEWYVKRFAEVATLSCPEAWTQMKNALSERIQQLESSRNWVMNLAARTPALIDFSPRTVEDAAYKTLEAFFRDVEADGEFRQLKFSTNDRKRARDEVCSWIVGRASERILAKMKRRGEEKQ